MKNKTYPDFIMIPYQLVEDERLKPMDRMVYGVIMWFSKMLDGRCVASNTGIAAIAKTSPQTVANSITRLEIYGYINRVYSGKNRNSRSEIMPLVDNKNKLIKPDSQYSTDETPLSSADERSNNLQMNAQYSTDEWPNNQQMKGVSSADDWEDTPILDNVEPSTAVESEISHSSADEEIEKYNKNIQKESSPPPSADVEYDGQKNGDSFTRMAKKNNRYARPEDVPEIEVKGAIAMFLPVFPKLFATGEPFAWPSNRKAVKDVLMTRDLEGLKYLIDRYVSRKDDKFRPEVNTIAAFCGVKFDRIVAYVEKTDAGLWAQKSISTPEQREERRQQYSQKINRSLERTMRAKEEWEKQNKKL